MFNLSLSTLYNLIFHLVAIERDADFRIKVLRASGPDDRARSVLKIEAFLSKEDRRVMQVIIFGGERACQEMELPATKIALFALRDLSEKTEIHLEDFIAHIRAIHRALMYELFEQKCYYYPPGRAATLTNIETDWSAAFAAIPAIKNDVRAGIDCWAMGHNIACVFHFMRAMEVGVQLFGKKLGVNLARQHRGRRVHEQSWGQILDELNPPLKALSQGTLSQKRKAEKLKIIQSYLYGVKDAWRNPIMHPRLDGYNSLQTNDLINQVRAFMTELSTIIKTKKSKA